MSNITGEEGSLSGGYNGEEEVDREGKILLSNSHGRSSESSDQKNQKAVKRKRSLAGTPDPNAEVIALSPTTLVTTNRFVCEICNKGFPRDQNLQLHKRGHNLPWKLKQRASSEVKKRVYVCPEPSCVHHNPVRALGDLTGIKKHFSRKHGEKKWKCEKCWKNYAVKADWKSHQKKCGTRVYNCDCGTIFSSFNTHKAFCDGFIEENNSHNHGKMKNSKKMVPSSNLQTLKMAESFLGSTSAPITEHVSIKFQTMNTPTIFPTARNFSSSSSSTFSYLHDCNNGGQVSGSIPISQKSFISITMAAPEQLSPFRPLCSATDNFQPPSDQSEMFDINHILNYGNSSCSSALIDNEIFSEMMMGGSENRSSLVGEKGWRKQNSNWEHKEDQQRMDFPILNPFQENISAMEESIWKL